jgi:redox-sensitive bicupin YhaK (pirin superfamily)
MKTTPQPKHVSARAHVPRRSLSAGLSIAQLHEEQLPNHLDPFLAFDHFEMAEPFFSPHPHAGFSAVTYMFPQSQNGFINRDSRGERIEIHPGDLHWTAADSGIMHEEIPARRGVICHGLQIFVNLHSSKKWMPPEVLHLEAAKVPRALTASAEVRVIVGQHGGLLSPLFPPTLVTLLDVVLQPKGQFEHLVSRGASSFLYMIDGSVQVGPIDAPTLLRKGDAVGFSDDGDAILAWASEGSAHFVVGGGVPLREPTIFYGPFCMNTHEEIVRVVADYEAEKRGRLERSF